MGLNMEIETWNQLLERGKREYSEGMERVQRLINRNLLLISIIMQPQGSASMESEMWNLIFVEITYVQQKILPLTINESTPIEKLREIRRMLIVESRNIVGIQSSLKAITRFIEQFQQIQHLIPAYKDWYDIKFEMEKTHEAVKNNIIKHKIDSAILTSINIFRKKIKPIHHKVNEIIALNSISQTLYDKFYSIDDQIVKNLNSTFIAKQVEIGRKFHSVKNNSQLRKMFRKVKILINKEMERIRKIHLSYLVKVKVLLKSEQKRKFPKKIIISKNQTDDELLKLIEIISYISSLIAELIVSLNSKFIARHKVSLNDNWKYFRKKK